jgi:XRE family transcriptional regulator, regulator of sulfur utilization
MPSERGVMMISKRDILIAALSCCATFDVVSSVQNKHPLMSSSVFDWETIPVKETKTGSTRDFFRAPTATSDQLECHVTTVKAGEASHAAHSHPEEELIIVKEGTLESVQKGIVKRAGPGSIIFEASNELHGVRNIGTTPATYYVIKWYAPGTLNKQ